MSVKNRACAMRHTGEIPLCNERPPGTVVLRHGFNSSLSPGNEFFLLAPGSSRLHHDWNEEPGHSERHGVRKHA